MAARETTPMASARGPVTTKMLGDAGEHFALSQFAFAGHPASKMPDGWTGYDLAVDVGNGLVRVSVKTRAEGPGWKAGSWFGFDERTQCDWLVFLFLPRDQVIRAWILPFEVARQYGNQPQPGRKDPYQRYVSFAKLNRAPLARFEGNWGLVP